jgi:hypothetical protein
MEQNKTAFQRVGLEEKETLVHHTNHFCNFCEKLKNALLLLRPLPDVNENYILQPGTVFLGHLLGRGRANHEWQVEEILIVHSWDENDCI